MNGRRIAITPSAYAYPLLIKQLLYAPLMQAPKRDRLPRSQTTDLRRASGPHWEAGERAG